MVALSGENTAELLDLPVECVSWRATGAGELMASSAAKRNKFSEKD